MNKVNTKQRLAQTPASQRILLLSHCLRRSQTCEGKYGVWGLECRHCDPVCPVNHLHQAATDLGYKGICIAPGGVLAVNYVKETRPQAIVAVACDKELSEGIHRVQELRGGEKFAPPIVVIPLTKDGCIDTEVDLEQAQAMIALGCSADMVMERKRA